MLDEALARLSPVQRQAVSMRLRGVADVDGIAAHLGLPAETVRASLAFAVAQLRMALSDAPLDRRHNDWLLRCRALHIAAARSATAPAEPPRPQASMPDAAPAPVTGRAQGRGYRLWPRLPVALALLVLVAGGALGWQAWKLHALRTAPPAPQAGPQRMPPPNAPEAPLTAPDFLLVLLQQQHPGLVEDLDFYIWLAEQDALR